MSKSLNFSSFLQFFDEYFRQDLVAVDGALVHGGKEWFVLATNFNTVVSPQKCFCLLKQFILLFHAILKAKLEINSVK